MPTGRAHSDPAPTTDEVAIVAAATATLRNRRPLRNARLKEAANAFHAGRMDEAEHLLSKYLEQRVGDASALFLLAETALKLGRKERALDLLARCVAAEPGYEAARLVYANTLYQLNRLEEALAELEHLLGADPHNILYLDLKAAALGASARHRDAMLCRRQIVTRHANAPELWVKYGKALSGIGEREEGADAFRRAIALNPSCGSAWWALADLKTWRFSDAEIAAMESALARAGANDRMYLHFALGSAHGDTKAYAKSFDHIARANAMKRPTIRYDADWLSAQVASCKRLFTREFLERHACSGAVSTAPIFVVGLQRAGSTLVEQILGSHSSIEAAGELPDITLLVENLAGTAGLNGGPPYPDAVAMLDDGSLRQFGENYLKTTRVRRPLNRPFFVDKNPYNFLHLGLIRLILPGARIVDVRRHPLACCWSNFSAHYESGALFAYRLGELGRAYADYVELMAHYDSVLPGRIIRVIYEDLVADPDAEIRRLLAQLELPFEPACLTFHTNARAMNSVSAEQVRKPIFRESIDRWRNYEPWLAPLKSALGPAIDNWRGNQQ